MPDPFSAFILIGLAFTLAGFVKGVVGMGLPTVAMGLLGLVMTPAQGAAILVIPSIVTNTWQLLAGPSFAALLKRMWSLLLCICIGVWSGFGLMSPDKADFCDLRARHGAHDLFGAGAFPVAIFGAAVGGKVAVPDHRIHDGIRRGGDRHLRRAGRYLCASAESQPG